MSHEKRQDRPGVSHCQDCARSGKNLRYGFRMDDRLDGLAEIAAYFQRSTRTIERWARERGLPVRYITDNPRSRVYAFASELRRWSDENGEPFIASHEDIADHIVARVADLSQIKNLYRKNFRIRFVLQKFGIGVKAKIETEYEIVNGSNKRQAYTQEVTIDDCEAGHIEIMSVSVDGKPIYSFAPPSPTTHHIGYSSYKGPTILIEPNSSGKHYIGFAKWIVNRRDIDFWYLHCGIATLGVTLETVAPSDFEVTQSYSSKELLTLGQHIDITWKKRSSPPRHSTT